VLWKKERQEKSKTCKVHKMIRDDFQLYFADEKCPQPKQWSEKKTSRLGLPGQTLANLFFASKKLLNC